MKKIGIVGILACLLWAAPARADRGVPGDYDMDGDVDLDDWDYFADGWAGPGVPVEEVLDVFDFDSDFDVDIEDAATFTYVFTGLKKRAPDGYRASTFTMSLLPTSSTTVGPGGTVDYEITGQFTSGTTLGLGLWGVNLSADYEVPGGLPQASPGADMGSFVKNEGMTNPEGYGVQMMGEEACGKSAVARIPSATRTSPHIRLVMSCSVSVSRRSYSRPERSCFQTLRVTTSWRSIRPSAQRSLLTAVPSTKSR